MSPVAVDPLSAQPPEFLDKINGLLSQLLVCSLSIKSFTVRWQVIRSKLAYLKSSISEISVSSHWFENPLLQTLLPDLHATLLRLETLADRCSDPCFNVGKLLMQSDLDMAAGWLTKLIDDLDILLRSGVLRQSTAIVLSQPGPGSRKEDLVLFIRDLFTRLQIGTMAFKKKAMESLIKLLSDDKKLASLISMEGNMSCLVQLLDQNVHSSVRDQAVAVVSNLVCYSDQSRRSVFEEGGLGPLFRIMESSSMHLKEKAAVAVEAITTDVDNAWAISAYGGVSVLTAACRTGSLTLQAYAAGAIKNIAVVEEIRVALLEEGAIPVLINLLISESALAQEKSANCISILASSGEHCRDIIIQEKGLQRLLQLLQQSSSSDTVEHVLRAILSLSVSESVSKSLSSSTTFIIQIAELIKHGNKLIQHISASLLSTLSISDGNKKAIANCMGALVNMMESSKPNSLQEVAAQAMVSLLTVKCNRKDLVKDEKSLVGLVEMLDPKLELVSKKFPVAIVAAIMTGGSHSCRKRLVKAGAYGHLKSLSEMDVPGAKKALQKLSVNRLKSIFRIRT
ncbi:protein CELLULOSE SYNTHASE INTERACTIVE 3-like [Impatiens glandulifera]|uniref:protein CELLULOSE SYNTHASE INTERACTIVE 3-like n=1 Tax=Impatiens glandulifera TaxID=253017 RepID=UPI001FB09A03|nr:protein CELLULOSE SYNTHASE INTERACTIVE 3-like [Impatiens glandulifera]